MLKIFSGKLTVVLFLNIALFLLVGNTNYAYAGGGGPSVSALESTQLANKAQLVKQVAEAIKQTEAQLKQFQNMLLNTAKLDSSTWKDASKEVERLRNLLKSAESLTFSLSFDAEKYDTRYPGYRSIAGIDYPAFYKERAADWTKYYKAAMEVNHLEAKQIFEDQAFLKALHDASNSAVGQNQMLQAGNQIAVYMAQQMSQLRLDVSRQIESQNNFMMNSKQDETDEQAAMEAAIGTWKEQRPAKGY